MTLNGIMRNRDNHMPNAISNIVVRATVDQIERVLELHKYTYCEEKWRAWTETEFPGVLKLYPAVYTDTNPFPSELDSQAAAVMIHQWWQNQNIRQWSKRPDNDGDVIPCGIGFKNAYVSGLDCLEITLEWGIWGK